MATASAASNTYTGVGTVISDNHADVLDVRFKDITRRAWEVPIQGLKYWAQDTTSRAYEMYSWVIADGIVPQSDDTDSLPVMRLIEGFNNTITPQVFRLGIRIERLLLDTDQFNVIDKMMMDLNDAARDTIELRAARPYNTWADSTVDWVCADGMNLVDSSRPFEVNSALTRGGATTWANEETAAALSQSSIATMRLNFRKHVSEQGRYRPIPMEKVVIPPDLEDTAITEMQSVLKPGSAMNDKNYLTQYGLSYEVWEYLTDTNGWLGFAPKRYMDKEIVWLWGKRPSVATTFPSADYPDVIGKRIRFVYQSGANRPHCVRGNAGA